MNSERVNELIHYILNCGMNDFNRLVLSDQFDMNERQVREAFYKIKSMGLYVLNKGDIYTVVKKDMIDKYYAQIQEQLQSDHRKAMKQIYRVNKQNKSLLQEYQLQLGE